jgi:hypothetical protein
VLDELSTLLRLLPQSVQYRGKQVAFEAMRAHCAGDPVAPGWLSSNWDQIRNGLFGAVQAT